MVTEQLQVARPAGTRHRIERSPTRFAPGLLIGLTALSVFVRPLVQLTRLPRVVVNADAVLTPFAAALVVAAVLLAWRRHARPVAVLAAATTLLSVLMVVTWALGSPRSWASLGLGFASVLLLPLALLIAVAAATTTRWGWELTALRVMVLAELAFGFVQYLWHRVPTVGAIGADLVNGTMSANLWPAFALPASLVIAVHDRGGRRFLWPAAVILLSIYAEAKGALAVWLPVIVVFLTADAIRRSRAAAWRQRVTSERLLAAAIGAMAVGVVVAGLVWTPSVQNTWHVFRGQTRSLEALSQGKPDPSARPPASPPASPPATTPTTASSAATATQPPATLRVAARALWHRVPASPESAVFGLGPGNSVSHAADVLVNGDRNGARLPHPSRLAISLLSNERPLLSTANAQSSLLGIWGDLGFAGAALYLLATALGVAGMAAASRSWFDRLLVLTLFAGVLAGGTLLDWPEQAGVVLPVALAALVAARGQTA